ncbi:MAG: PqqD family peptide modification chaperone [Victivallaceae bacterium]|nr:PqqD family peptide modification chaperone [Victivallaceae bacterium]
MIKVNPSIVVRKELEGWGVLFDPDTGDTFGLNAVGVFIWEGIEAGKDKETILAELTGACEDVPENAAGDFDDFVSSLAAKGYISCEE